MECFKIENLSFTYPTRNKKALENINLSIEKGDFVCICGKSGCGKTTLLRLLKPVLAPHGEKNGNIFFEGTEISRLDIREQASKIGYVAQDPDNQIVTDKVWHELAFGPESLGYSQDEIRARVSETATFFGIEAYFHEKISLLSGGQKQLLSLASVMVMQPSCLIVDEPTSQLDPIAAQEFMKTLEKINQELGTTVILSEHRLEDALAIANKVIVLDEGKIIANGSATDVGKILADSHHPMSEAMTTAMRIYAATQSTLPCPVTVKDGKRWLEKYLENKPAVKFIMPETKNSTAESAVELKDVWFRYEKESHDILRGLSLDAKKGEIMAILGGNGVGKSTLLSVISSQNKAYRGKVCASGKFGVLPQNPAVLFSKKTVHLDLCSVQNGKEKNETEIMDMAKLCCIEDLLEFHPYDLSGGEKQKAALAKVLLGKPEILLMDEPTKGMDAEFKKNFAGILNDLKKKGICIIMVSHDIEFCAQYADRCGLLFDGNITTTQTPGEFFAGKSYYTTAANRIARSHLPDAVLASDVIKALGCSMQETETPNIPKSQKAQPLPKSNEKGSGDKNIARGIMFAIAFAITMFIRHKIDMNFYTDAFVQILTIVQALGCLTCFIGQKEIGINLPQKDKLSKRTLIMSAMALITIPLTIYLGIYHLNDRKYYFVSMLIIIQTFIPFTFMFEQRKPQARELVIISILCAIATVGRTAFFMVPQFKPVMAIVIISAVCFGAETGFLVGAVTAFVSNFFFGQGPWTPWQMFALGIAGFIAGIVFKKGFIRKTKLSLALFGAVASVVIYGGIMNPASVIMYQNSPTLEMIVTSYIMGLPVDLVHGASTWFFLWLLAEPMIDKLERIKIKYGLIK